MHRNTAQAYGHQAPKGLEEEKSQAEDDVRTRATLLLQPLTNIFTSKENMNMNVTINAMCSKEVRHGEVEV